MMRIFVFLAILGMLATPVFAHTGPVTGTPGDYQLIETPTDIGTLAGTTVTHDETLNNPTGVHKGWYLAGITNKAVGTSWTGMLIQAQGTGVYLVQGTGLIDEWGITGDSVLCNKTATATYSGSHGPVTYDGGGSGTLYGQVYFQFATPIAYNQKVSFKIYTDNTAYSNGSFGILFTPTIPEPSALAAMLGGLIGLAGLALKRRK
jgi:hypothetical protein